MRLALIGPSAPLRGGIAQYHDRLAAALGARGHEVRRVSFRRLYPKLFFPGTSQVEPCTRVVSGAAAGARGMTAPEPLLDSLALRSWWRAAGTIGADAAVCEWWHPFFAPALGMTAALIGARGIPTVFVVHNLEPHERMPGGRLLARLALGRAAACVAQSQRDAARLAAKYPRCPITVVLPPPLVPPPCPHAGERDRCARVLGVPPAANRLLFFGYVRRYKGLPTLIEALASLPPRVQLVVAGEIYHQDADHYRRMAARWNVGERVVFLDRFLPSAEIACLFSAADVVVLPYWEASQSAVAPLAMALGRAVVASAVGGIPEVVRDGQTGALVPPRDSRALAVAIMRALESWERWGTAARTVARAFEWSGAAAAVEALVGRVLQKTPDNSYD